MNPTHRNKRLLPIACSLIASSAFAGDSLRATIIEGSGFFSAPGIELAQVGSVNLNDPSDVIRTPIAGELLRFGGADQSASTGELIAFENTTNAMRIIDTQSGGNTLIDSIGYMDAGVAGFSLTNDNTRAIVTTTVGAFVRFVTADAQTGQVLSVNNILTDPISSLAVVPEGHPSLTPGDLYGLALTLSGGIRLVHIDLEANTIVSSSFVSGIPFDAQFETGLDFAPDGTLYAVIQGFDEVSPDNFVEVSSHLFTIDTDTNSATNLGVIESNQTWDAVTLVINTEPKSSCPADLTGEGDLNFLDVSAFLSAFGNQDPSADFTNDGNFNFLDVSAFLSAFSAGCP